MWKTEPPSEEGWYWFRLTDPDLPEGACGPMLLLVSEGVDGCAWAEDTVNQERYRVRDMEGLWAGPLAPPEGIP